MAYATQNNLRVLWLTRTGSQLSHVSREALALPMYGRRMICLHETVSKIDLRRFNTTCRAVRRAGRCPYWPGYPRVLRPPLTASEVKEAGRRLGSCPHDCLVASMSQSRIVAATHMQLSSISWLLSKWHARREKTILVLDEGQHIIKSALSMVRDSISLKSVEKAAREAQKYGFKELAEKIQGAVESYSSLLPSDGEIEAEDYLPDIDELILTGEEVQEAKLRENFVPASYVLSLADFKISLRGGKPVLVREGKSLRLESLGDPVETLRTIYDGWHATIIMSATISGELLESMIGGEVKLLRAGWPFEEDNLRVYLVRQISTKFEKRDEGLINDMAWVIDLASQSSMKTLVFMPSFDLLEKALGRVKAKGVLSESPGMSQEEVEALISEYQQAMGRVMVAVYNGRLSEGVDLSANLVMCIGVPFPPPTVRMQLLTRKLTEILGDEGKARVYGYIIPATWSAVQAAGRSIRKPEDKAVVFLVDDRYKALLKLLPKWFTERIVGSIALNDLPIALGEVR